MEINNFFSHQTALEKADSPFTELLTLFKTRCFVGPLNLTELEMEKMTQHLNNAIDVLLQGLQGLGNTMGMVVQTSAFSKNDFAYLAFLISSVSNLVEALTALRTDIQ